VTSQAGELHGRKRELVELLPISSKRRTEVLSNATNQGIEVINQLKIEIVFSDGNGADFYP
jgi:hypothetical protein